jgi:hypothetical protein
MKEHFTDHTNARIDRTLRVLGSATPAAGLEERIAARLAQAHAEAAAGASATRFFRLPQLAFGLSAATMAGAVIVVGSVSYSRHILPVAPGLHLPGTAQPGVGAASAAHVAAQPVTTLPQDRPRSVRDAGNGRAVISSHAKKPTGVAVPKTLPSTR